MKTSYLDYAMSVIVSRALPDVRDGLKPVHRRILYACQEAGYVAGRPYRKSSRIVGDVMGKYHPHGDSAIYDALARMTQDWSMRVPLIDGQGNFGSMDPDPPAAMRYTEARLAKVANFLLGDIDRDTVDFTPNYDASEREPQVLPARFPNLLVNGAGGIAVGMATNIPPHNLGEVLAACRAYMEDPAISSEALMEHVKGPDFPTGGLILGLSGIRSGRPETLTLRDFIEAFIRFREEVITRRSKYELFKARERAHILLGLVVAVTNLDEVVKLIRGSASPAVAREKLLEREWPGEQIRPYIQLVEAVEPQAKREKYKLSEAQVQAILERRLHLHTALGRGEVGRYVAGLATNIGELLEILANRVRLYQVMREHVDKVEREFATPRLSELAPAADGI